jgi:hypothetical protein
MQIIELELDYYDFFCPATGEQILYEDDCNEDAKSLQAYWVDLFFEEPFIKNIKLANAWENFLEKNENKSQGSFKMLEDFFRQYPEPHWVVFSLTNSGVGCGGESSSTSWLVLDLNVKK